jgi:hypothetical protein
MIAQGVTDFSEPPNWAFNLDFIEAAIRPRSEGKSETESPENVIIRGAFRPKVIDGESED